MKASEEKNKVLLEKYRSYIGFTGFDDNKKEKVLIKDVLIDLEKNCLVFRVQFKQYNSEINLLYFEDFILKNLICP